MVEKYENIPFHKVSFLQIKHYRNSRGEIQIPRAMIIGMVMLWILWNQNFTKPDGQRRKFCLKPAGSH